MDDDADMIQYFEIDKILLWGQFEFPNHQFNFGFSHNTQRNTYANVDIGETHNCCLTVLDALNVLYYIRSY